MEGKKKKAKPKNTVMLLDTKVSPVFAAFFSQLRHWDFPVPSVLKRHLTHS